MQYTYEVRNPMCFINATLTGDLYPTLQESIDAADDFVEQMMPDYEQIGTAGNYSLFLNGHACQVVQIEVDNDANQRITNNE